MRPDIISSVSYELLTPIALADSESSNLIIGSGLAEPDAAVGLENVVAAPPENFEATVVEAPIPAGLADDENLLLVDSEVDFELDVSKSSSSSSKSRSSSSSSSELLLSYFIFNFPINIFKFKLFQHL